MSNKKLAQGMSEHNKAMSAAKTEADKVEVVCAICVCLSIYLDPVTVPDSHMSSLCSISKLSFKASVEFMLCIKTVAV